MRRSERARIIERANAEIGKALKALDRASELAEVAEDWYCEGRIDSIRAALVDLLHTESVEDKVTGD